MGNAQAANELVHCVLHESDDVAARALKVYPGKLMFVRFYPSSRQEVAVILGHLARNNKRQTCKLYIARIGPKKVSRNVPFALQHAIKDGDVKTALRLLEWFPAVDVAGNIGTETLLHTAVREGSKMVQVCHALLQRGASLLAKDLRHEITVLETARCHGWSNAQVLHVFGTLDWEPASLRDWWLLSCACNAYAAASIVTHGTRAPAVHCALQDRARVLCADAHGHLEGEYCALIASFLSSTTYY